MRTKEEILEDSELHPTDRGLEVSIDIRDTFQEMNVTLGNIHFELMQVSQAIWQSGRIK